MSTAIRIRIGWTDDHKGVYSRFIAWVAGGPSHALLLVVEELRKSK